MESLREMEELLLDLGIELPTPAYLIGVILFGIAGIVVFVLGKRRRRPRVKWIGVALMLYPYVVWGTVPLYVIGAALLGGGVVGVARPGISAISARIATPSTAEAAGPTEVRVRRC